jgi:hypothetical protein
MVSHPTIPPSTHTYIPVGRQCGIAVGSYQYSTYLARLAQSVEHETLNLRVVGSSPTLG